MTSVLLIDTDAGRCASLAAALAASGHEVTVAASGGFALTMLERKRPDVIVSRFEIDDMYAHEFCAIVRSDPLTSAIPFILLTERAPSDAAAVARAVAEATPPPWPAPDPGAPPALPAPLRVDPPAAPAIRPPAQPALHGTEMRAVVRAVYDGRKTGRLRARLGAAEGALVFEGGRLVHAEFQGQEGQPAVTSLLAAATASHGGVFNFVPWDGAEVPRRGRTVDEAGQELLLQACTGREPAPPPGP